MVTAFDVGTFARGRVGASGSCAGPNTGGLLSSFELIARPALDLVLKNIPGTRDPLAAPSPWYVLMEVSGGAGDSLEARRKPRWRTRWPGPGDATPLWRRTRPRRATLWRLRETISEAAKREGASIKHDISVPVASIPAFHRGGNRRRTGEISRRAAGLFRPYGRRQPAFQFQCAPDGGDDAPSPPNGTKCSSPFTTSSRIIRRLDQRRAWHRPNEARRPAALQIERGAGRDADVEGRVRSEEHTESWKDGSTRQAALAFADLGKTDFSVSIPTWSFLFDIALIEAVAKVAA